MQDIGNIKSIIYGAIITVIFMISSCEFNSKQTLAETTTPGIHVSLLK